MKTNEPTQSSIAQSKVGQRRSYLLRLWCSNMPEETCWKASLEDPHTGERIGFSNLEHLFAYLIELTEGHAKHDT